MAAIDENLRTFVLASTSVTAFGPTMQQNTIDQAGHESPYIWYMRAQEEDEGDLDGTTGSAIESSFDIECISESISECQNLAAAVKSRLDHYRGAFGANRVKGIFVRNHDDSYAPKGGGIDAGKHVAALDVTIFHNSTT